MSPKRLLRIQFKALLALMICTVAAAVLVGIAGVMLGEKQHDVYEGFMMTMAGGAIGILPVLIYGAPLYALAEAKRRATWPMVILIGALPGAAFITLGWVVNDASVGIIGTVALPSGLIVASCTHVICKRGARA